MVYFLSVVRKQAGAMVVCWTRSGQHLVADTAKLGPTPVVNLARNQGEQGESKLPIAHRGEPMYLCT